MRVAATDIKIELALKGRPIKYIKSIMKTLQKTMNETKFKLPKNVLNKSFLFNIEIKYELNKVIKEIEIPNRIMLKT